MATVLNAITYARQLAQTDSNGITDTLGIAFANDALQNITREMLNRKIDAAQTQESYTNLTTTNPNTYAWPSDLFALKTVEVDYTGGGGGNFLQAAGIDVANLQNSSFDWLRLNQSTQAPLYDNRGDTFELFPVPTSAITGGLRIFYFLTPTEYTATGDTITYPLTLDYRCVSARIASLYAASQANYDNQKIMEIEYQKRLQDIIRILAPSSQQPVKAEVLRISGWQF